MPTVTAIKPQKSKRMKAQKKLDEGDIAKIVKASEFQSTLDKLLRFATLRPRSLKEIGSWLQRKKVHESMHEALFNRLRRLNLVDDRAFASWWVETRQNFKPKPKRVLTQELKLKGVDKNIIEDVLDETEVNELKIAKWLVNKNFHKWQKLARKDRDLKITNFLYRKGFSWEVIKVVLK